DRARPGSAGAPWSRPRAGRSGARRRCRTSWTPCKHPCIHMSMTRTKRVTTTTHAAVRLPRAERRAQLVRAAASAFLTNGYEKTSMEDVARAAGVTRLIVYRIFESKQQLYLAVLGAVLEDIGSSFEDEQALSVGIAPALLGVARRHPDGFRLL